MENLSDELMAIIVSWIPPLDLLQSTTLVNKYFARLIEKHWMSPEGLQQSGVTFHNPAKGSPVEQQQQQQLPFTNHQIQRCCIFRYSSLVPLQQLGQLSMNGADTHTDSCSLPSCIQYASILPTKEEACTLLERGWRVCAASTTDHAREALDNVLRNTNPPDANARGEPTWWSSKPSASTESEEILLFTSKYPLALLSRLRIKPLLDPYRRNHVRICYTWKTIVFKAYHLPLDMLVDRDAIDGTQVGFPCVFPSRQFQEEELFDRRTNRLLHRILQARDPPARLLLQFADDIPAADDRDAIEALLGSFTPVLEFRDSNISPDSDEVLTYELSTRERSVVANLITITLLGKNHEQHARGGYYACVECVECDGIPLYESSQQGERASRGEYADSLDEISSTAEENSSVELAP